MKNNSLYYTVEAVDIVLKKESEKKRMDQIPANRTEELLIEALVENACYHKQFPTHTQGYVAEITSAKHLAESNERKQWNNGKLEAILSITKPTDDIMDFELMDGGAWPIYLSVAIIGDDVTIQWELPPNPWTTDQRRSTSSDWPTHPAEFLWKPETE